MRITFFIALLYFISTTAFAQNQNEDSIKVIKPFDSFVIKNTAYLTDTSNSFKYSEYIWSDKRSISEVMDQRPGYFVFDYFGLGGRNAITNSSILPYGISAFRDGIQVNDLVLGGFDVEIFSINEVEAVEEISGTRSMLFGINSIGRSFNVITKDYFTPLPFSQLRYSQDRSNSLYADVFYSQAYSKKFGLQFGITKHSLDGRFENSAFDTWKTRTRLNFNLNERINLVGNLYYNYINRGMNGGAINGQSNDSLLSGEARVIHPDIYEDNEFFYYDLNFFGKLFRNPLAITKINLYSQNLLTEYFRDSAAFGPSELFKYSHIISYGMNSLQSIPIHSTSNSSSELQIGFDMRLNRNTKTQTSLDVYSFKGSYEIAYDNYSIIGLYRYDIADGHSFSNFGAEGNVRLNFLKDTKFRLFGGIRRQNYDYIGFTPGRLNNIVIVPISYYIIENGIELTYHQLMLKFYSSLTSLNFSINNFNSYNITFAYNPDWLGFNINYERNYSRAFPKHYLKGSVFYKGELFDNNLKLRTGFDFKYYNIIGYYEFSFPRENQFLADFFIGARIGNANINITVANILNSLVYNTYIYPLDNRGGLLNAISRFTIVWDFLN